MRAKLGLADGAPRATARWSTTCWRCCTRSSVDFTSCFRALSSSLRGDASRARSLFAEPARVRRVVGALARRGCRRRRATRRRSPTAMDRVNPVYIPRNHLVEEALAAATAGDLEPFERLLDVLARPFDERPGLEAYAAPAPPSFGARTGRSAAPDRAGHPRATTSARPAGAGRRRSGRRPRCAAARARSRATRTAPARDGWPSRCPPGPRARRRARARGGRALGRSLAACARAPRRGGRS